ncbi:MAG TPA: rod-binding protein [Tepidisphaeraceae bacterium]
MKIKTAIAADNPLNLPGRGASLNKLSADDFHKALEALAPAARSPADAPAMPLSALDATDRHELLPLTPDQMLPGVRTPAKPMQPLNPPAPPLLPLGDDSEFVPGNPHHAPARTEHDKVVATAQKLVAQTFYGTMLKQMRQSPWRSELFDGGRGGQAFSALFDQHLAERMAHGADSKLVNSIARKLEGKTAYQRQLSAARSAANPLQNVRMNVAPNLRA